MNDQSEEASYRFEEFSKKEPLQTPLDLSHKTPINQLDEHAKTAKKCPKCGYERKTTDYAPDWQCPSCGVAYVKVSGFNSLSSSEAASRKSSEEKTRADSPRHIISVPVKLLLVGFICLTIGYFSGREHLKYELRQTFIAASEKIKSDLSSALGHNRTSDKSIDNSKPIEKESKLDKNSKKPFSVSLIKKGFMEHNYQANIPSDAITFTIEFTNLTGKNVRAFDGRVIFTDLLDNQILTASLAINDPILENSKIEWNGRLDFNQFIDSLRFPRNFVFQG